MVNELEKIIKPEYMLSKNAYTTFNAEGQKVPDESKEGYVILQTTSQKMFFPLSIAKNLLKDLAQLLAEKKK